MRFFNNKKLMIECIAVMIVLIIVFILILPHFLNAQISRRVAIRTKELQAFTALFRSKELQYLRENGSTTGAPDNQKKVHDIMHSSMNEIGSLMNIKFLISSRGGPCMTESFRESRDGYEMEGMHIVTTVNRFKNYILWVTAAPVTTEGASWPQFKNRFRDTILLHNYISQRGTELGYYNAEFYREYYRPYTFDVSNGLGSDGAIIVIESEPLAR